MRGLTPAERALIHSIDSHLANPWTETMDLSEEEQQMAISLAAQGRIRQIDGAVDGEDDYWFYEPTDAGRLALHLWPATAATPGAGGQ